MRPLSCLALALLLIFSFVPFGWAREVTIETAVPLQDDSEQSVKAALTEAIQTIARGALAMDLPWVLLNRVVVLEDTLTIQIFATDTDPRDGQQQEHQEKDGQESSPGEGHGLRHLVLINATQWR